jgi:hypothetical protein
MLHLQNYGTLKDTQGALRHASITTTGNVYAGARGERDAGGQLSRHSCTGWLDARVQGLGLRDRNIRKRARGSAWSGTIR